MSSANSCSYYREPHEFAEQELEIAQAIASHVALATEHKRLEAESRHLAAIIENSDDAILSKDLNGIITSWNEGGRRIFGYSAAEALGKPVSMLAPVERMDEMRNILDRVRRGKRVEPYDTVRRRKDGQPIHLSITVSPIRNAAGEIAGASEIARDISGRKRADEERARLLAAEREARKTAEILNRVAPMVAAELDLEKLVQAVTDMATEMVGAEFGSFFHNVVNEKGESYMLYTLSGVSREAFAGFPMPRNTEVFAPTFRGEGVVRSTTLRRIPAMAKIRLITECQRDICPCAVIWPCRWSHVAKYSAGYSLATRNRGGLPRTTRRLFVEWPLKPGPRWIMPGCSNRPSGCKPN